MTKMLMAASALFLACLGLAASFLPQEILAGLRAPANADLVFLVQIGGALYVGFALTHWMAKGGLIGGIYNRPLAMGGFAHYFIGAIVLAKGLFAGQTAPWIWAGCVAYTVFAVCFGLVAFGSAVKAPSSWPKSPGQPQG